MKTILQWVKNHMEELENMVDRQFQAEAIYHHETKKGSG